jgi:hypothetical protein
MTIKECIDIVDNLKPNQYSIEDKVEWLSFIDQTIINSVLKTHEGYHGEYDDFAGYSPDNLSVPLIVPSPYDRLYTAYLKMKIDEENGETARYNNSATMFNSYMMEYKRWYNKTHMPINVHDRKPQGMVNNKYALSDAMYENLRREVLAEVEKEVAGQLSEDRIYDIIMRHVYTHTQEFKGKDGSDASVTTENIQMALGFVPANEESVRNLADKIENLSVDSIATPARIGEVTLLASAWKGSENLYSQVVSIDGVTKNTQVDLTPSVEQLAVFYEKDLGFVTENENGVVTVFAIGQKPQNDYTIQVTLTEVDYE